MRLLIVEDDLMLGETLSKALREQGYVADWTTNGQQALNALTDELFDLAIMDLGLPGLGGLKVIQELRMRGNAMPILILTACDRIQDRVAGLDAGGDDYLLKPFDLNELFARIRALLRRPKASAGNFIMHGELHIEPLSFRAWYKGKSITLARREFSLLELLMNRPGQVFTRQQLEQALYGWNDDVGSNALEVHIHHLRKKLSPSIIRTIRGVGYTLDCDNDK